MIDNEMSILIKLGEFQQRLDAATKNVAKRDESALTQTRLDIIALLKDIITFYNINNALGLWEKDCIVSGMSALIWDRLYLSISYIIDITIPENKRPTAYPRNTKTAEEISNFTVQDLMRMADKIETLNYDTN